MDLKRSLEAGDFVVIAEMEPPKGVDVAAMVGNAAKVKEEVTAFMVPEMSNAVMRMSALGVLWFFRETGWIPSCRSAAGTGTGSPFRRTSWRRPPAA